MLPEFKDVTIKTEEEILAEYLTLDKFKNFRNCKLFDFESWNHTFNYRGIDMVMKLTIPFVFDNDTLSVRYNPSFKKYFTIVIISEFPEKVEDIFIKSTHWDVLRKSELSTQYTNMMPDAINFHTTLEDMTNKIDALFDRVIPSLNKEIEKINNEIEIMNNFYGEINNV